MNSDTNRIKPLAPPPNDARQRRTWSPIRYICVLTRASRRPDHGIVVWQLRFRKVSQLVGRGWPCRPSAVADSIIDHRGCVSLNTTTRKNKSFSNNLSSFYSRIFPIFRLFDQDISTTAEWILSRAAIKTSSTDHLTPTFSRRGHTNNSTLPPYTTAPPLPRRLITSSVVERDRRMISNIDLSGVLGVFVAIVQ